MVFALDEAFGILGHLNFITYLFADTAWVIHVIFLSMIGYKLWSLINYQKNKEHGTVST